MSDTGLLTLTPDTVRDLLQQYGYRAELATDRPGAPYLRSATAGLPFELQFVDRMADEGDRYAGVTFVAVLRVVGDLSLDMVNDWNNAKRFGRLRRLREMLVLDMDVLGLGGVTWENFQTYVGVWDQLVQALVPHVRAAVPAKSI